jgi:hypothetical protein
MLIEQAIKGITSQITNLNTAGIFAQAGQLEEKKVCLLSFFFLLSFFLFSYYF